MSSSYKVSVNLGARPAASGVETPTAQPFDLFPTRIWQVRLHHLAHEFGKWIAATQALRESSPVPAGRTVRQGWNSRDDAVLDQPPFVELRSTVYAQCCSILGAMGLPEPKIELQSWVNMHDRGGFNFVHMHEGALLSGCFYLQVPAGSGSLVFRDPRPGAVNGYVKGAGPNGHRDVHLRPEAGLLVLFPHWLEHYVEPHDGDAPRICIPFNALKP